MEEKDTVIEEDDIIMPDEEVETPTTEESDVGEGENTNEPTPSEDEDKKILDYLNKKGIKYNGEQVEVKSVEDLVNTYQKGLNYDNLKNKRENEENAVMSYVSEMASKMGMTPSQYIEQVKEFQKKREQEAIETDVQNMMTRGVDEEVARRVAKTEAALSQLEKEKLEVKKQKEEIERKAKEDKEYEDFIKEYPDVDASKIPAEVFKEAKEIGLSNAYAKYENNILREKIKTMEQNAKNASSSVVTPTSNGSAVDEESEDAFLQGFNSVI